MTDRSMTDFTELRGQLEARRRDLSADLHRRLTRIREHGFDRPRLGEDEDEDGTDIDVELVDLLGAMLRRIDAALDRLHRGRYGRCTRCGGPIAHARLRALPFAARCQACEVSLERDEPARRLGRRVVWAEGYVAADPPRREER
jgi:DnaK suppressor protein